MKNRYVDWYLSYSDEDRPKTPSMIFSEGFQEGKRSTIEELTSSFEEWWNKNNYSGSCYCWNRDSFIASELERTYHEGYLAAEQKYKVQLERNNNDT